MQQFYHFFLGCNRKKEMRKYTEEEAKREILHQIFNAEKKLLEKIWERLLPTLGTITLLAIFHRIIKDVSKNYPFFSYLSMTDGGLEFNQMEKVIEKEKKEDLTNGFSIVISKLTLFLSEMTGNILVSDVEDAITMIREAKYASKDIYEEV